VRDNAFVSDRGPYRRRKKGWSPTAAQARVLDALAEGMTNAEIAVRLGISPETVKWHVSELLSETGLEGREDLTLWWRSRRRLPGLLPATRLRLFAARMALGGAAVVAVITAIALLTGLSAKRTANEPSAKATAVGEATLPLYPTPSPDLYGAPFFMQAKTARFAPTVRISAGDLPHAVIVPVVDYAAATNMFADTRNAWWTTEDMAPPSDTAMRYKLEFVLASPDLSEIRLESDVCWFAPGDPPVVGPDCAWKGYVRPNEFFEGMLNRYVAIDRAGLVQERPTLADALVASQALFGATIKIGQSYADGSVIPPRDISGDEAGRFLRSFDQAQIAMFGAIGVGITGRGPSVPFEMWFGDLRGPVASYVTPGSLAPYGFVMTRRQIGSWAPASTSDGQAWVQRVLATPPAFDDLLYSLGYRGGPAAGIDEYRMVPLGQGTGDWSRIAGMEIWRSTSKASDDGSQPRLNVMPPSGLCEEGCEVRFVDPALLVSLSPACRVEIRPAGQEPFPEAVRSPVFRYYPPDDNRPGILEQTTGMIVGNGNYGLTWPIYAPPELDTVLAAACSKLP
jgi:DNA-binding CsgD family transcriptional regulator